MDPTTGLSFNLNLHPSPQNTENHQEGGDLMEVISRMDRESKRMTQMVGDMFDKCSAMHHQLMDLITHQDHQGDSNLLHERRRKRKGGDHDVLDDHHTQDDSHHCCDLLSCGSDGNCCKRIRMINFKPKISTAFIRVDPSDPTLAVKDGYQWRKYGQKVTRDNPSPRAYFKCSFAPICPVKKKVQKSVEDPTVLVATYEGEHNHKKPCSVVGALSTPPSTIICSSSVNLSPSSHISSPSPSVDRLARQKPLSVGSDNEEYNEDPPTSSLHHWLVEQMVSSLTKDPSFASTLVAAISDKVIEQTFC